MTEHTLPLSIRNLSIKSAQYICCKKTRVDQVLGLNVAERQDPNKYKLNINWQTTKD